MSSASDRRRLYARIGEEIDILVTHGPPYGIFDSAPQSNLHSGCPELLEAVRRIEPKLHVFGHVHGTAGRYEHVQNSLRQRRDTRIGRRPGVAPMLMLMSRGPEDFSV